MGSTRWILNYESRMHVVDSNTSGFFSVRVRRVERTLVRSLSGRETLVTQTTLGETDEIVSEIPPGFLGGEEICSRYVADVLSKQNINSWAQLRLVPSISKDAINMRRRLEEEEERKGFLVEAEAEAVRETGLIDLFSHDDDYGSEGPGGVLIGQEDCIICLEELSSSSSGTRQRRTIMELPCSHNFHRDCILSWLRRKHSCPTCRDDI